MRRFLLDTHALIWFLEGSPQLSSEAKKIIENPADEKFVSIVSFWEMAIKLSLNKLELNQPLKNIITQVLATDLQILPINFNDILIVSQLPFHHRDPFDRILIAQAKSENLAIIGQDQYFKEYEIPIYW